jgi:hypothetical protein
MNAQRALSWGCLLTLGLVALAGEAKGDVASDIVGLTGMTTRFVWVRADAQDWAVQWSDDWAHPFGAGTNPANDIWKIVAFDTDEGAVRVLENALGAYNQPMLTPSGQRVIWTKMLPQSEIWICDWDGSNKRMVRQCTCTDTAIGVADPGGVDWVYVGESVDPGNWQQYTSVYRYQVDNPAVREQVWGANAWYQMGILRDGSKAGGSFPAYNPGTVTLPNGTYTNYISGGCNPCIAPDDSQFWAMEVSETGGIHAAVYMFDIDTTNRRLVYMNDGPGMNGD